MSDGKANKILTVFIAKGALKFISSVKEISRFKEAEVLVLDYSRYQANEPNLWNQPCCDTYDEIIILDSNVVTGMTQKRVKEYLQSELSLKGPIKFAATIKGTLGYKLQDMVIKKSNMVGKKGAEQLPDSFDKYLFAAKEVEQPPDLFDKFLIAIVGPMCCGRDLLRMLFRQMPNTKIYRTPDIVYDMVLRRYGEVNIANIRRLQKDVLHLDKIAVARHFIDSFGVYEFNERYLIYDGVMSLEELVYVSYILHRPPILISCYRNVYEMVGEAIFLDWISDPQHLFDELLARENMGATNLEAFADFRINCMGTSHPSPRSGYLVSEITHQFRQGVTEMLEFLELPLDGHLESTKMAFQDIDFRKLHIIKDTYDFKYAILH